ncbi:acyltransferase family protein [Chitinophaga eiseniae]|uniref:acyltransferase family protein n=1 Tax=Chitinophaga eiseniae TaxID=634771 RepID=UPI001F285F1A|nr:acyltransferase family protein [Chitinophaga eiseniae]
MTEGEGLEAEVFSHCLEKPRRFIIFLLMHVSSLSTSSAKPHYEVLDGLRGTAAITIVVFHFLELVWFDYSKNPLGHGFLAVDFFFCLSGFVIGYAYDRQLSRIGYHGFFRGRLLRLHPLVLLGIGYLAMRWYDQPLRRWLKGSIKKAPALTGGLPAEIPSRQV